MDLHLVMSREDAAKLLARVDRERSEHVKLFARGDCWQDRLILALHRSFELVGGPVEFPERCWVCTQCYQVNPTGRWFCSDCETARPERAKLEGTKS